MLQVMPGGHCMTCHKNYEEWTSEHPCMKNPSPTPCVKTGECAAWKRKFNKDKEICICAAVKIEGQIFRGNRHGDCMVSARARLGDRIKVLRGDQGFITSRGRFVSREEGRQLQDEAGIESVNPNGYVEGTLFSEDLY